MREEFFQERRTHAGAIKGQRVQVDSSQRRANNVCVIIKGQETASLNCNTLLILAFQFNSRHVHPLHPAPTATRVPHRGKHWRRLVAVGVFFLLGQGHRHFNPARLPKRTYALHRCGRRHSHTDTVPGACSAASCPGTAVLHHDRLGGRF